MATSEPGGVGMALHRAVTEHRDKDFVHDGHRWHSYAEVEAGARRIGSGLAARGVTPGQVVAIVLPNGLQMIECFFGCALIGAIQAPLNTFLKGEFLAHQLRDSGASVLITDTAGLRAAAAVLGQLPNLRLVVLSEAVDATPAAVRVDRLSDFVTEELDIIDDGDTPLSILYTSGTSGLPRGCVLTHEYYLAMGHTAVDAGFNGPGDRVLTTFRLFHCGGQGLALMSTLVSGAAVRFLPEFSASRHLQLARDSGATVLWGVGAVAAALLAQPPSSSDREHQVRQATFSPLSVAKQVEFEQRFGISLSTEMYGQTECLPISFGRFADSRRRSTVGRPADDLEVAILDERNRPQPPGRVGEIAVRPRRPNRMFLGYWNSPSKTLDTWRGLWHHTGDWGRLDEDGSLYFIDRRSNSLRRRGEMVSSLELEAAIAEHPSVERAAVVAVPSPLAEDDIRCFLELKPGETLGMREFAAFCREQLPYYAMPTYVDIIPSIPVNSESRAMKAPLRDLPIADGTWNLDAAGLLPSASERR